MRDPEKDLFGEPISEKPSIKNPVGGYAARPGSGPSGETCRTCRFAVCAGYHDRNYWKCQKIEHAWTFGPGSDIRLKAPACRHWEKRLR